MSRPHRLTAAATAIAAFALAGCAAVNIDDVLQETGAATAAFTQGGLQLDRSDEQRAARAAQADALLAQPLSRDDAVRLALVHDPAVQALLARGWAELASAQQSGRLPNPVFSFERLRLGGELEIGRMLSFGLLDLILLPQRIALSRSQSRQVRIELAGAVIDQVTQVRQAWVRAVAARQSLHYATQVRDAAEAGAELARRMQQVGNFSKLQRARQQVFYADAAAQLASAQQAATAAREELVRALGLDEAQAARLRLPERLPDLPPAPRDADEVSQTASRQRLDVQLARAQLDAAGKARGLDLLPSWVDAGAGARRDTVFTGGEPGTRRGYALDLRLPLFDWGDERRATLDAQTLAAVQHHDAVLRGAASQLRESYAAYRSAYDLARHYRDEIVPLRQAIADENLLLYNGMLIGVLDLLAESREQMTSVIGAIQAQQQFWLADAALAAAVIGRPAAFQEGKP